MTLEYLEIMEDVKNVKEQAAKGAAAPAMTRRRLAKSFKSNTRIYDDGSIEVEPQAKGEPKQTDVKKVGRNKRYATTGKNPLTCVELKCPEEVADKAAYFYRELVKLTRDIAIGEPQLPESIFLLNREHVKVRLDERQRRIVAWLTFDVKGLLEIRRELYALTSEIDKCFVINNDSICPRR